MNVNPNAKLPFTDALGYGGQLFLIGVISVFAVLGTIFLCLLIFKTVFSKINVEKKAKEPVTAPTPVVSPSVHTATDAEIVAVIAAAIAMAEEESGDGTKFRVVSFKRK